MSKSSVATASAVVVKAGKPDEMLLSGLQSIALPFGVKVSQIEVGEFGTDVDVVLPGRSVHDVLTVDYHFVVGDLTQSYIYQACTSREKITDIRFMLTYDMKYGDFAALNLLDDPDGFFTIGTLTTPQGKRNDVISGSATFLPAGKSALFSSHAAGHDLYFLPYDESTGELAHVKDASGEFLFVTNCGFKPGMVALIDHLDGMNPLYLRIQTVTEDKIEFEHNVGDEPKIPLATVGHLVTENTVSITTDTGNTIEANLELDIYPTIGDPETALHGAIKL